MSLIDFIFPRKCLGCRQNGRYFCSSCINKVRLNSERICPICSNFSLGGLVHPGCRRVFGLDGLTSVFAYKGLIKKAIQKLKYSFLTDLSEDLIEAFLSFVGEDKVFSRLCLQKNVFLVPIPLHSSKKRWRGFNQTELLGKIIAENLNISFLPNLLIRKKKTQPQIKLKKKARHQNLKNAFATHSPVLNIQPQIILFDDVWTSGATLREAAKTLKRSGFSKVWALTLAR